MRNVMSAVFLFYLLRPPHPSTHTHARDQIYVPHCNFTLFVHPKPLYNDVLYISLANSLFYWSKMHISHESLSPPYFRYCFWDTQSKTTQCSVTKTEIVYKTHNIHGVPKLGLDGRMLNASDTVYINISIYKQEYFFSIMYISKAYFITFFRLFSYIPPWYENELGKLIKKISWRWNL